MLNIILSGAPGSGKGTQSELIVKKYGLQHLSTGELLRAEIATGSEFGKQIDALISKGNLVPDDVMLHLIDQYIDNLPTDCKGVIYDGFPRTINQARAFDELLKKRNQDALMIDLIVNEEDLIQRLLLRGEISGRSDDNLDTIKKRLVVFHERTEPQRQFYKEKNNYHSIDGNGTIEDIFSRIDTLIAAL
ncbi:MAG: adenylate kinase [Paludibacteraceae bacterium]|nr:adenylate kinase [Paludibacteraceae bacterium]